MGLSLVLSRICWPMYWKLGNMVGKPSPHEKNIACIGYLLPHVIGCLEFMLCLSSNFSYTKKGISVGKNG